jgi:hypothetical protein
MRLESWRNGFAATAFKGVVDLSKKLNTQQAIANEVAAQLCRVPITVTTDLTYYTYAYQWGNWSEDDSKRKVHV